MLKSPIFCALLVETAVEFCAAQEGRVVQTLCRVEQVPGESPKAVRVFQENADQGRLLLLLDERLLILFPKGPATPGGQERGWRVSCSRDDGVTWTASR